MKYELPESVISPDTLARHVRIKKSDLHFEVVKAAIDRSSLKLQLEVRLNFSLPKFIEKKFKVAVMRQLKAIRGVDITYTMDSNLPSSGGSQGRSSAKKDDPAPVGKVLIGRNISADPISYDKARESVGQRGMVTVEGEIFEVGETRPIKKDLVLITFAICSSIKTLKIKSFINEETWEKIEDVLEPGLYVKVMGNPEIDRFDGDFVIMARNINRAVKPVKQDTYPDGKRVELHVHTKMSDNDGFNDVTDLVNQAAAWNQPAVAITDHGVVQSFPDAAAAADKLAAKGKKIKIIYGMEGYLYDDEGCWDDEGNIDIKRHGTYHIILLVKNLTGLKNLYKLVSYSHIDYFYKKPRLPRSILEKYREGIILGSACEAGEVYRGIEAGKSDEELLKIASYYDYLEIQPLGNNQFLIDNGTVRSEEDLKAINKKILSLADQLGKMTVATTDSHYPTPDAAIYRNIVMATMGFSDTKSDSLYLRTTNEMMDEFSYLGDRAHEVVVENTNKIADMIEEIRPVPSEKCPPKIEGAEEELRTSCFNRAHEIYGDPLPKMIEDRLNTELNSVIGNGYAVMYVAAQMLVKKSNSDGYLVGSRGSVGSSFAATMAGITEINPLPPHYVCPKCKHFELTDQPDKYDIGYDMPDKMCPECGAKMRKDGFNIPFATFLGFKGDKEPDIDLNFAGEYQPVAHHYVGEIFGEKNIFKAGTVSAIKDKTAYGYVKHYIDDKGMSASKTDVDLLVKGCTGVKRTTGQHPGGIIVCPADHEIFEFTPIQRPANKRDSDFITTHYDYHKIDKNLLKLDILGHDAPSILKHLQDMTGVKPTDVPLDDKETMSIFTSLDALHIKNPDYKFKHGTYAIPEFGTHFTRSMLDTIKPTTYSELVKMSGFSHGTAVWQGNAEELIQNGTATVDQVISCRDDIMNYLMSVGVEDSKAFNIMEHVRKNKPLKDEEINEMKSHGVPDWYIQSCVTLQYLFPRAHAAAYVMHALRFAWFKVHYPPEFYAAYLTSKVDDFDVMTVSQGLGAVERRMDEINDMASPSQTEKDQLTALEVVYEMLSRGYEFSMPILGVTEPLRFSVVDGKVNIPFRAFPGIGDNAAQSVTEAYEEGEFKTLDEVKNRTKLTESNIEDLQKFNVFGDIPQSAQVSILELMQA